MSVPFQVDEVEELLALMEQWDIAEMHLTAGDAALDLVRAQLPAVAAGQTAAAPSAAMGMPPEPEPEVVTINAPVVGVFHLATRGFSHGHPRVGDAVQAGQIIGSIKLMHVPTDLVSPVSGVIDGILAEDGAGVAYAHPLMSIRPYEEVSEDEAGMLPPPQC